MTRTTATSEPSPDVSEQLVEVTPEKARQWIKGSVQHHISLERLLRLVAEAEQGKWNPELHKAKPVKIREGAVTDGHHRLFTALFTDTSLPMWVVFKGKRG